MTEYVKDEHGPGEYHLVGIDSANREIEVGVIRLKGSSNQTSDGGMSGLVQTLLSQTNSQNAEWLKRMEQTMQPQAQQNPLELLQGVMDLNDRVNGKAGDGDAAAASASTQMMEMLSASGDKSMQMMMMMMNQQAQAAVAAQQQQQAAAAQQQQMMMALFSKPKEEDPMLKLLMAKLLKEDDSGGGGGMLPPPPPPPPEAPDMVGMITAIAGLLGNMNSGGGEPATDDFKEFLIANQRAQEGNNLSMKDIIELVTRKDDQAGTDDFRSTVDNMAALLNISQNMNRQQEGGAAAGI